MWKETGSEKPSTGIEIKNEFLAAALLTKVEFKKEEWKTFQVFGLFSNSYIKAGDCYFKSATLEKKITEGSESLITGSTRTAHTIVATMVPDFGSKTPEQHLHLALGFFTTSANV